MNTSDGMTSSESRERQSPVALLLRFERRGWEYLLALPPPVRLAIYLALLFALLHGYLQPTVLQGQLWIKGADEIYRNGGGYHLFYNSTYAQVDSQGRWLLKVAKKYPRSVSVDIRDHSGTKVGTARIPLPPPIYDYLSDARFLINIDETTDSIQVRTASSRLDFATTAYAEPQGGPGTPRATRGTKAPGQAQAEERSVKLRLRYLEIIQTGDPNDEFGELYFKIVVDGRELDVAGFPTKNLPSTHLLLTANTKAELEYMLPLPGDLNSFDTVKVHLKIYDYDKDIYIPATDVLLWDNEDVLIGDFEFILYRSHIGTRLGPIDTKAVGRFGKNSFLTVEIFAADRPGSHPNFQAGLNAFIRDRDLETAIKEMRTAEKAWPESGENTRMGPWPETYLPIYYWGYALDKLGCYKEALETLDHSILNWDERPELRSYRKTFANIKAEALNKQEEKQTGRNPEIECSALPTPQYSLEDPDHRLPREPLKEE